MSLTSYNLKSNSEYTFSLPEAFGQTPGLGYGDTNTELSGPQDPSSLDAGGPGDPGNISNSTYLPPDATDNPGGPDQNDTLDNQDTSNPNQVAQIANPEANFTNMTSQTNPATNQSVPEFGPLSGLILGASIVAVLWIGQRTFLKFDP